ncbi:26S proteasome non-ATPase regulatory subunit 6 [Leucoagaricus sp. SymC.cos]|nr:26S proteasome non-ATPase regulatory subunit 6 [Leucoagaricus sp. SymC.cos]
MADDTVLPIPNLALPQHLFVLKDRHAEASMKLLEGIQAGQMAPYYKSITSTSSVLSLDKALLESLEKANKDELKILDERLAEADRAVEVQKLALEKTPGLGLRIDIVLTLLRIGFFFGDHDLINTYVTKAEALIEEGGDWGRRNRLKKYNSLHLLSIRQFKRGGELLLDALSTFTATELISYHDFVALTVIF